MSSPQIKMSTHHDSSEAESDQMRNTSADASADAGTEASADTSGDANAKTALVSVIPDVTLYCFKKWECVCS